MRNCAAVVALCVLGCADEPVRRVPRQAKDKAALYGDPGLLPTREGEAMRRQAAQAGELEEAIRTLQGVEAVRADVEERTLVVLRLTDAARQDEVLASTRRIVATVVGEEAAGDALIEVSAPPATAEEAEPAVTWPIGFAVLGLGFFLGLTFDRTRRVLRNRRRAQRRAAREARKR